MNSTNLNNMDNQTLIYIVAAIGIVSLIGIFIKMKEGFGEFNTKVYGITIIALLVTILAVSSVDNAKLSPVYGILGAIAGYLFGMKKP